MSRFAKPFIYIKVVMLFIIALTLVSQQANAQDKHFSKEVVIKNQKEIAPATQKITIYPKILITHQADFPNFMSYLYETKEQYRSRRSAELIKHSQTVLGTNHNLASKLMQAFTKFDNDYEQNKNQSIVNIGNALSEQFKASLFDIEAEYMLENENAFIFSYDKLSTEKTNDTPFLQFNSKEQIAKHANYIIYGFWSEYMDPYTSQKGIKVSLNLEEIGGKIITYQATGAADGQAMGRLAKKIFDHFKGQKQYEKVINPQAHLSYKQPLSLSDLKTHNEAREYCKNQSQNNNFYRLPYAREVLNIPGKYHQGGLIFIDIEHKDYAVADKRGNNTPMKLVASIKKLKTPIQKTEANEKLSYFCVKGKVADDIVQVDMLYETLYAKYYQLKQEQYGKITKNICQDQYEQHDIKTIKNLLVRIKKVDNSANFKAIVHQCVLEYIRFRPNLTPEISLLRNL